MPRKKKLYDKNGRYVPTFKELGITDAVHDEKAELPQDEYEKWYSSKLEAWQLVNESRLEQEKKIRAERNRITELNHWYNQLPNSKVRALILSASHQKDLVFETFLTKIKVKSPLFGYYLNLVGRIEDDNLTTPVVSFSKLSKFPKYSIKDDKLIGSSHCFVAMFISCFPPRAKGNKSLIL